MLFRSKTVTSNCINNTNITNNSTTHDSEINERSNKERNSDKINERNEIIEEEDDDRQLTAQEYEAMANKVKC